MFDPTLPPYTRVQTYSDGNPPVVTAEEFYNPVQDQIAQLFGGKTGSSISMSCDEFSRPGSAASGQQAATDFLLNTATNANALGVAGIVDGDHGIWRFQNNVGAAAHDLILYDADKFVGARQFIWTARIRLEGRANFETRANEGLVVGMWGGAGGTQPAFRTGSAHANWWAYYDDAGDHFIDTGVAAIDDSWFTLVVARKADNFIRWYIGVGTAAPTLRATTPVAIATVFTSCRRFVRNVGTAASASGDGFYLDKFACGVER